jgi:hypothetical protein
MRGRAMRYRVAPHTSVGGGEVAPEEWLVESEEGLVDCGDVFTVVPGAQHAAAGNSDGL